MTQFIPSDNVDTTDNQFVLHPAIERYSQSDDYYNKAKEYWKLVAELDPLNESAKQFLNKNK